MMVEINNKNYRDFATMIKEKQNKQNRRMIEGHL
jgi:hypothetical protein